MGLRKPKKAEEIKLPDLTNAASAAHILSGFQALDGDGEVLTGSIPSQAAQTITPGTSNKTIAAGSYLSGTQTIKGDSNLKAANILKGKSIFGVTGSVSQAVTGTATQNSTGTYITIEKLANADNFILIYTGSGNSPTNTGTTNYALAVYKFGSTYGYVARKGNASGGHVSGNVSLTNSTGRVSMSNATLLAGTWEYVKW